MSSRSINTKFSKVFFLSSIIIFLLLLVYTIQLGITGNIIFSYQPIVLSPQIVRGSIYSSDKKLYAIETAKYKLTLEDGISVIDRKNIIKLIQNNFNNLNEQTKNKIENIDSTYTKFEKYYVRQTPQSPHLSNFIGKTNYSLHGVSGIEKAYDEVLSKQPVLNETEILYGDNIYLTANSNLQFVTDEIVKANTSENIKSILAIVVDNTNGEIKSLSDYNLNNLNDILNKQYPYGDFYTIFEKSLTDINVDRFKTATIKYSENPRDDKINIFNLVYELTSLNTGLNSTYYKELSIVDYAENDKGEKVLNTADQTSFNNITNIALHNLENSDSTIKLENALATIYPVRSNNLDAAFALAPSSNNRYSVVVFVETKNQSKTNKAVNITSEIVKNVFYILDFY